MCIRDRDVGVLWPNGWMNLDATCYESTPPPMPHCVRRGPSSPKGAQQPPPLFSAHVYCGHSRTSQPKRQRTAKEHNIRLQRTAWDSKGPHRILNFVVILSNVTLIHLLAAVRKKLSSSLLIIIIIIRKFRTRTRSQALSMNRRRGQSLGGLTVCINC